MTENVLKLPETDAARSALRTIKAEKSGLADLERALGNGLSVPFSEAVRKIRATPGRVVVTGIGKSGHVDTHCFEPVFGGKFIRDRHEVTGGKEAYRGETLYNSNAELGRAEYTYWNSVGGVSRGTMVARDGVLDFGSETHTAADGSKMSIATQWRSAGADAYEVVSIRNGVTGDKVVTYRRVD